MFSKSEVLEYLGNDGKQQGDELVFPCPLCVEAGGDSDKNHLKFNSKKGVITCFANDVHSKEIRKQIIARRNKSFEIRKSTNTLTITPELIEQANETLLESDSLLEKLEKATGIKAETVKACKIGFSLECQVYIFPCYDMHDNLFGAEFRPHDFSKLPNGAKAWKAKGTDKRLCSVNAPIDANKIVVIEGFKDGYNLFQYLSENGKAYEYQIVTPSNGVATIKGLLKDLDTDKYEEIILCLDNDKAGKDATKKIALSMNREIYQLKLPQDKGYNKDFSDWYNTCNDNSNLLYENIEIIPNSIIASKIGTPAKYTLGMVNKKNLDEETHLKTQILEYRGRYLQVWSNIDNNQPFLGFTVLSNYVVEPIRNVLDVDVIDGEKHKYLFEIRLNGDFDTKSEKLILTPEDKANLRAFRAKVYEKGNFTDVFSEKQFAQIFDNLYKENTLEKLYRYSLPGRITNDLFLYKDAAVEIYTGKVFHKKGDVIKRDNEKSIILHSEVSNAPALNHSEDYTCKQIAEKLIESMLNGYSNSAQPFLVFGVASMSVFRDLFKQITGGFPIPYLYGPTQGGKTNLLHTICSIYGFDKTYISSGSSTVNATWKNLAKRSRIPVILDEVLTNTRYADPFENLIKCGYDCKQRERMFNGQKEDNQPVNATLILSSNHTPPQKEEVLNRLVYCEFDPKLFNVEGVIDFNTIRDKYLSNLLIAFLAQTEDRLKQIFFDCKNEITEKYQQLRERDKNNMAVARTGVKILFEIAEMDIPAELQASIDAYLKDYQQIYDVKTPLDKFISYLPLLKSEMKINGMEDYEVKSGILNIHYALAYKHFARYYRQTEGEQPPKSKDILSVAKYHAGIENGTDQVAKSCYINGKKKRCLVIDISQFEDLEDFAEVPQKAFPIKLEQPELAVAS